MRTGGSTDTPTSRATGCAAPLPSARASAPKAARCRTPTATAVRARLPAAAGAAARATPLAIQRKLPSEIRPPARPPTAPRQPAARPPAAASGPSASSITRLTCATNSPLIALLVLGPPDHPEELAKAHADAQPEP